MLKASLSELSLLLIKSVFGSNNNSDTVTLVCYYAKFIHKAQTKTIWLVTSSTQQHLLTVLVRSNLKQNLLSERFKVFFVSKRDLVILFQNMAASTEPGSGFAGGLLLLKGSCSFPLSPYTCSTGANATVSN